MKKLLIAATAVLCVLAMSARASVLIDNFNEGRGSNFVNSSQTSIAMDMSSLQTTNTIGGARHATLNWQIGTENTTLQVNPLGDNAGTCTYSSSPGNDGYFALVYGNSADLNADLTQNGTNNRVDLHFSFFDVRGTATVTFVTTGGGSSTLSQATPFGGAMDTWMHFNYADFSGSADFANVDKITIQVDGAEGADITLDQNISTSYIPEPATAALFGIAGAALIWKRAMRRRG